MVWHGLGPECDRDMQVGFMKILAYLRNRYASDMVRKMLDKAPRSGFDMS